MSLVNALSCTALITFIMAVVVLIAASAQSNHEFGFRILVALAIVFGALTVGLTLAAIWISYAVPGSTVGVAS